MGLHRSPLLKGLKWGTALVGIVAGVVAIAVTLPFTRVFFRNDAYASLRVALFAALVVIPIKTVIPEEPAFRGVLQGSLTLLGGVRTALVGGAAFFGLRHVATSLGLTASNAGLGFTWLRHRTGSAVVPMGLHWALNSAGTVAAAVNWGLV